MVLDHRSSLKRAAQPFFHRIRLLGCALNSKSPQLQFNVKVTAYYVHMKTMLGGQQLADRFEVHTNTTPQCFFLKEPLNWSTKKPGLSSCPWTPGGKPALWSALLLLGDCGHSGRWRPSLSDCHRVPSQVKHTFIPTIIHQPTQQAFKIYHTSNIATCRIEIWNSFLLAGIYMFLDI